MAVVPAQRFSRLRLAPAAAAPVMVVGVGALAGIEAPLQRTKGVIEWPDIPAGVPVHARLDFPLDWVPEGGTLQSIDVGSRGVGAIPAGTLMTYRFEHGAPPNVTLPGGAVVRRTTKRILVNSGNGLMTPYQANPAYAAFAAPQGGTLAQKGKLENFFTMPGLAAGEVQEWLRLRWVGTQVVGATLIAAGGLLAWQNIIWTAAQHRNLVPGSIQVTLPTSGGVLLDTGDGRLVGAAGDGIVDYVSGVWKLNSRVAETGNILVTYEHSILYSPLDCDISWDSLANQ